MIMFADSLVFDPSSWFQGSLETLHAILECLVVLLGSAAGIWIGGLVWRLWRSAIVKMGWDFERDEDGYIVEDGMRFEDEGDLSDYYAMKDHPDEWDEEGYQESLGRD